MQNVLCLLDTLTKLKKKNRDLKKKKCSKRDKTKQKRE